MSRFVDEYTEETAPRNRRESFRISDIERTVDNAMADPLVVRTQYRGGADESLPQPHPNNTLTKLPIKAYGWGSKIEDDGIYLCRDGFKAGRLQFAIVHLGEDGLHTWYLDMPVRNTVASIDSIDTGELMAAHQFAKS